MQKSINIEVDAYNQVILWFVPFHPTDPEVLNSDFDDENINATLSHGFDIEKPSKQKWILHIDFEINIIPIAKIKVRTSFKVSCSEEALLDSNIFEKLNELSIEGTERGFFEQCKAHNIVTNFTALMDAEEMAANLKNTMIVQFYERKKDNYSKSIKDSGTLDISPGLNTLLIIQGTFIVLDNVLHSNKLFNLKHNQKVFHEVVPEPIYYTIKLICLELNEKKIKLNFMHAILFQICLDCALQLLLNQHAKTLQPAFIAVDFTLDKQNKFIEYGSDMLRQFRNEIKTSGSRVTNLEIRYDWNTLIK